jgi:hypothetical protein
MGNNGTLSSSLINSIATKANTSDTFTKSVINNDVYLTIDINKRIVGTLSDNKFKVQICDDQGTFASDDRKDVATIEFNTLTKKQNALLKMRYLWTQLIY